MNILEHYIIEVKKITEYNNDYITVEVLCDCWGDKRVVKHTTTREAWERALKRGYFMA